MNKFYITTPIYYVNDKPHIGHAYTTIAADVLARYYRQKVGKKNVFFLTGTDEHGSKVAESAQKVGLTPQKFCDKNSRLFKESWQNLNISNNYFIRTTDKRHYQAVEKFMLKLYKQGDIYEGKYEGLYCIGCEKFLTERELIDGKCPYHKDPPKRVSERNYFFNLKKYLPRVKKLIKQDEIKVLPKTRKTETLGLFKQGLEDFSVSRERVKWGIPLPFDKTQKTYVWVEALQNYISAIGYGDDLKEFKERWQESQVIHLMAKDILKFHAIYWPALLLAGDLKYPDVIFAHGFFTINGQKMSKSLGNIIDPNELTKKYGADATRYLLLSQFSFGTDGDVKTDLFPEKYTADLANGLGNVVSRVTGLIGQNDVKIEIRNPFDAAQGRQKSEIREFDKLVAGFLFDQALKYVWDKISEIDGLISETKPWELAKAGKNKELTKILNQAANGIYEVSQLLKPFLPETAEKVEKIITAKKIKKAESLFPRLES